MRQKGFIERVRVLHGLTGTPTFYSWKNMMTRCYNPNNLKWDRYGGRGIKVCELLRTSPRHLIDVIGEKPDKLELDRVQNDEGYHCGQCAECIENGWALNIRWASRNTQARNRRDTRRFSINGETKPLKDWAEQFGISYHTVIARWVAGMRDERLFSRQPVLTKTRSDNTSGFTGVSRHGNKWAAYLTVEKQRHFLGLFQTPDTAAAAYGEAIAQYRA